MGVMSSACLHSTQTLPEQSPSGPIQFLLPHRGMNAETVGAQLDEDHCEQFSFLDEMVLSFMVLIFTNVVL